jgi:hypothetical protein
VRARRIDHRQEMLDLVRLRRTADVALRAIRGGARVAVAVEDRDPRDAAVLAAAQLVSQRRTAVHAVGVQHHDDAVLGEARGDLLVREELLEPVTPASPGRAEIDERVAARSLGGRQPGSEHVARRPRRANVRAQQLAHCIRLRGLLGVEAAEHAVLAVEHGERRVLGELQPRAQRRRRLRVRGQRDDLVGVAQQVAMRLQRRARLGMQPQQHALVVRQRLRARARQRIVARLLGQGEREQRQRAGGAAGNRSHGGPPVRRLPHGPKPGNRPQRSRSFAGASTNAGRSSRASIASTTR